MLHPWTFPPITLITIAPNHLHLITFQPTKHRRKKSHSFLLALYNYFNIFICHANKILRTMISRSSCNKKILYWLFIGTMINTLTSCTFLFLLLLHVLWSIYVCLLLTRAKILYLWPDLLQRYLMCYWVF